MRKLYSMIRAAAQILLCVVFRKKETPSQNVTPAMEAVVVTEQSEPTPVVVDEPPQTTEKQPRKRKDKSALCNPDEVTHEDFSGLIDSLDVIFQSFALPDDRMSWLNKRDAKALRRVGVSVPLPNNIFDLREDTPTNIDMSKPLPVICCVSLAYRGTIEEHNKRKLMTPVLQYAIKCGKLPYNVTQHSGIPYMVGTGYRFNTGSSEKETVDHQTNKLFWFHSYVVVSKETGNITFCDELIPKTTSIPIRNSADRRNYGASHRRITRHLWAAPAYIRYDLADASAVEHRTKATMRQMFDYWASRDSRWQAAVYNGKNRVTFGVEYSKTKTYFKNRDKTVKASDGRAKRIFHHVDAHTRELKDGTTVAVKEHCRGLREFMWLDYNVKIIAPKFTSDLVTAKFDIEPTVLDQDTPTPAGMLDLSDTIQRLVKHEDTDRRVFH